MFVKSILATLGLVALAMAGDSTKVCKSDQQIVCKDNGSGGVLTLGNILDGALGDSCSGGDVYCCDTKDIDDVSNHALDSVLQAQQFYSTDQS
jgi:glutamate synthase domain-containing protein 3